MAACAVSGLVYRVTGAGPARFRDFVKNYQPKSYQRANPQWGQWRSEVFTRFDGIMSLVSSWGGMSLRLVSANTIPRPESDLRITPKP
jgi:hypothetical protein